MHTAIDTPEDLFIHHGARLRSYARKFVLRPDDADDCLQEAFLRIVLYWRQRREPEYTLTWAHSVVRKACLDMRRRRRSRIDDACLELDVATER